MKITMTVCQLKALRTRWRENEAGFIGFADLVWSGYTLVSPIGRLLDTTPIRYDRANICLTDAIYLRAPIREDGRGSHRRHRGPAQAASN